MFLLIQAEEFGRKLAHQFPWSPAAGVAVGLALRRRYQSHSGNPSTAANRKQIIKVITAFASTVKVQEVVGRAFESLELRQQSFLLWAFIGGTVGEAHRLAYAALQAGVSAWPSLLSAT